MKKVFLSALLIIGLFLGAMADFKPGPTLPDAAASLQQPTPTPGGPGELRLRASNYQAHDLFGSAVAVDGDFLAVGAPGKDLHGERAGAIYVFERSGPDWIETAQLFPRLLKAGDRLGLSVALDGDTIAAGAPYAATPQGGFAAGTVSIFVRHGFAWREQARLTARDGQPFDLFGSALALEGDTLLVGARGADASGGRNTGAAYVFHRQGERWSEQARLSASGGAEDDFFGHSVALLGDLAAVGAFGHDDPAAGENSGAVYLFQRREGAWYAQATLTSSQPAAKAQFGYSLAFTRDPTEQVLLAVGANQYAGKPVDPRFNLGVGRVELFLLQGESWQPTAQLEPEIDREQEIGLYATSLAAGRSVLGGNWIAIGSQFSHRIYLYQNHGQGWGTPSSFAPAEYQLFFGRSLALSGEVLAVGSPSSAEKIPEDVLSTFTSAPQSGTVYLYDLGELK